MSSGKMSFKEFWSLTESHSVSEETENCILENYDLEEAVNSFADLPDTWKKIASAYDLKAGQNSKVTVIEEINKLKKVDDLFKFIRKVAKADGALKVIEVNGEPAVAIVRDKFDAGKYKVLKTDGNTIQRIERKIISGTGKWTGGKNGSFKPAKYRDAHYAYSNLSDTATHAYGVLLDIAKDVNGMLDEPFKDAYDVFTVPGKFSFRAVAVHTDLERAGTAAERYALRQDRNSMTDVKQAALKKFITSKLAPSVKVAEDKAREIFSDALAGKPYKISDLDAALKEVQKGISSLSGESFDSLMKNGAYRKSWEGKAEKTWAFYDFLQNTAASLK